MRSWNAPLPGLKQSAENEKQAKKCKKIQSSIWSITTVRTLATGAVGSDAPRTDMPWQCVYATRSFLTTGRTAGLAGETTSGFTPRIDFKLSNFWSRISFNRYPWLNYFPFVATGKTMLASLRSRWSAMTATFSTWPYWTRGSGSPWEGVTQDTRPFRTTCDHTIRWVWKHSIDFPPDGL